MVATSQCNRTGAGDEVKAQQQNMRIELYESFFFNTRHCRFLSACGLTKTQLQHFLTTTAW
jgi:hypothetical protein